jgi:hypothetical protein
LLIAVIDEVPGIIESQCGRATMSPNRYSRALESSPDLPDQLMEEIAHFFVGYKKRESHDVQVTGWPRAKRPRG